MMMEEEGRAQGTRVRERIGTRAHKIMLIWCADGTYYDDEHKVGWWAVECSSSSR